MHPRYRRGLALITAVSLTALAPATLLAQGAASAASPAAARLDRLKAELSKAIDARATMAQQMVDQVFSYGELGMQEVETSKYLTGVLEKNGFTIQRG
ncbi:MAG: hypothetical protein WCK74_12180, partial [Gemmatimonadaceae bacterium]